MGVLSLGIPGVGMVSPGTHFCALYSGRAQRDRLLFPFLEEGLRHGDQCLCLVDDADLAPVREKAVGRPGPGCTGRPSQLDVRRASDVHLRSGQFHVEDAQGFLAERMAAAIDDGFDLLRVAGEMSWVLPRRWVDLHLYESALNRAVEQMPAVLMCLYDVQTFGADMLVEVLRTHPKVLLDRTVIDNPYFVHPTSPVPTPSVPDTTACPLVHMVTTDGADHSWGLLTDAELRVISCLARGMANRAIGEELSLSRHTVDAHLKHVYLKLGIHSRVELTVLAMHQHGPVA